VGEPGNPDHGFNTGQCGRRKHDFSNETFLRAWMSLSNLGLARSEKYEK
jgi:hypothetical protein